MLAAIAKLIAGIKGYALGLDIANSPLPVDYSGQTYAVTLQPSIGVNITPFHFCCLTFPQITRLVTAGYFEDLGIDTSEAEWFFLHEERRTMSSYRLMVRVKKLFNFLNKSFHRVQGYVAVTLCIYLCLAYGA